MLDSDLRLITPVDPEGSVDEEVPAPAPGGRYFQLTHDYLVHALRDWLTRKQRETRRGRAELLLAERASLWNNKPEDRYLPSFREWANIRLLTEPKGWSETAAADDEAGGAGHRPPRARRGRRRRCSRPSGWKSPGGPGRLRCRRMPTDWSSGSRAPIPPGCPRSSPKSGNTGGGRSPHSGASSAKSDESKEKFHASLALVPYDESQVKYLYHRLLGASPPVMLVIRDQLMPYRPALIGQLWDDLRGRGRARLASSPLPASWRATIRRTTGGIRSAGRSPGRWSRPASTR